MMQIGGVWIAVLFGISGCAMSRAPQAVWQPNLHTHQTSCLMALPPTLPLHQPIDTECQPRRWRAVQQYTSALGEPCVTVVASEQTQRWCFAQHWRQLPSVLAHEP